ncbi:hypothetical protein [Methylobacterium durans]|uniref:Uncharacterized protein n=1 Tax=Methylobacterium durans TaxID=2202825 RepID=A0A2U8W599_9HYPH|nr:hypothetical protein [Methylobacterium durans]AWN41285.1 hypothetical protein DK389_13125 [Methylobacterium durans]
MDNRRVAKRRLAGIMVAEIVSYSRLMGADAAGMLRRLDALRRELIDTRIATSHCWIAANPSTTLQ